MKKPTDVVDTTLAQKIAEWEHKNSDPSVVKRFLKNANWVMVIYLTLTHALAVLGLITAARDCKWGTLIVAFGFYWLSAMGITAGVHRLWSHKSYEAKLPFRILLMICNSIANQGTIHHWVRDHRVHHRNCETDADPHNAERGFFFSHMGWLLVKKHPSVIAAGRKLDLSDLKACPEVRFQRACDPWWNLFWCFVVPALATQSLVGDSFWNGFLVAGAARYVIVLHLTWLVNSAAHCWGDRPYDENVEHRRGAWPSENAFVALGAAGEGWHNWHHAYPHDYAASELGISQQFNPTKLFIDAGARLGLVSNRRRALRSWQARKERLAKNAAKQQASELPEKKRGVQGGVPRRRSRLPPVANGAPCHLRESLTGVPLFRVRRVVTDHSDSHTR